MGSVPPYSISSRHPRSFTSPHGHLVSHYHHYQGHHPHAYTEGSIHSVSSTQKMHIIVHCRFIDRVENLVMLLRTFTLMAVKVVSTLTLTWPQSDNMCSRRSHPFNPTLSRLSVLLEAQVSRFCILYQPKLLLIACSGGEDEYLAVLMQQKHIHAEESPDQSWNVVFTVCPRTPCCVEVRDYKKT